VEVVKNVVNRQIVVIEVLSSELSNGGALSEEVRDVLIFVSAEWTLAGVSLPHLVKVVVEPAVACNDVDCGSIIYSLFCFYESGVEVTDGIGLFVARNHLGVLGSIWFPFFLVKLRNLLIS
jgi:hypothetical protein